MSERPLAELAFRHGDLVDALEAAAITSGLTRQRPPRSVELAVPPTGDRRAVATLLDRLGARLGIEVEEVEISAAELAGSLAEICPALIELPGEERRWLVVLGAAGGRVRVLDASYGVRTIRRAALVDTLIRPAATPSEQEADALVMAAGLTGRRSLRARRALVAAGLRHAPVAGLWLLRAPASRPLREQATRAGLRGRVTLLLLTQLVISGLWLSAWWIVGRTTLGGIGDPGWLSGWALCLAALVPARALVVWLQGALSFELGALLRRRLLAGALAIDPERTKADGLGRLLGLVMECDALESLGTSGGATVILSIVELAPVPFALAAGAAGWLHVALLALWLVPFGLVIRRQLRDRMAWTEQRLHLTQSLVDNMIGHRTRLAQMPRERWHAGEDRALTDYDAVSTRYDRVRLALLHFLARGWLVVAVGALIPEVAGHASPGALAISIGAVLYAHASFERLASGMGQLTAAIESWRRVRPVYRAADAAPDDARAPAIVDRPAPAAGRPILQTHGVSFGHAGRSNLFRDVDLEIRAGDRVLLEGPSGAGKSTLASLFGAQRRPDAGLILLDQLDLDTVGVDRWRKRVALVPQFHENHVIAETFLFNLLMGRAWPPSWDDHREAMAVCRALGLDRVLEEMPAGLNQTVGDSGWNLSHGERSRLYLARALLQDPDVLVLDESLASLDPELLDQVGRAVLERARTLVLIAHP